MEEDDEMGTFNGATGPHDAKILDLALIKKGVCSQCGANLEAIIEAIKKGEMDPPETCPQCNRYFLTHHITEAVLKCGNCQAELPVGGPSENVYCRKCGCILIWSPELQKKYRQPHAG